MATCVLEVLGLVDTMADYCLQVVTLLLLLPPNLPSRHSCDPAEHVQVDLHRFFAGSFQKRTCEQSERSPIVKRASMEAKIFQPEKQMQRVRSTGSCYILL